MGKNRLESAEIVLTLSSTSPLILPTSINVECGFSAISSSMTRDSWEVGIAKTTSSGSTTVAPPTRSLANEADVGSESIISTTTPRWIKPSPIEVPINPEPTTLTLVSFSEDIIERYLCAGRRHHAGKYGLSDLQPLCSLHETSPELFD